MCEKDILLTSSMIRLSSSSSMPGKAPAKDKIEGRSTDEVRKGGQQKRPT